MEQAFARSVLYGFEIEERLENGSYLVDLTPFLMEDWHGVARKIKGANAGSYSLDKSRSVLWMENTKNFPENTELEALLTFKGEPKGRMISSVTPDARLVSVVQHHSFIKLPDSDYKTRAFHPGAGNIMMSYYDYAGAIGTDLVKRLAIRHRLEKKDPGAEVSEAVEPIVYYLDNGTPEPVRSALMEGASWWNQAFEAIGYKDAFQVKILPEDADPMDVRYNVIQWVHRSTRGWSYGASVTDPRTGEIIKGHVSLGSLRVRQDYLIAQALLDKPFDRDGDPMLEIALARIRQLAAHEVGHTLGFTHNFAASISNRASVMDYPHPLYELKGGQITAPEAYDKGIGEWDKVTVAYLYGTIPEGANEKAYLDKVLDSAAEQGLQFISDSDSRARGGAHPYAHLWDNGKDAAQALNEVLDIREKGISQFDASHIQEGEPYSVLEDVFVPLYLFHRYQTEAAVKVLGGVDYSYAVKGASAVIQRPVPEKMQEEALDALLRTLSAEELAIPKAQLALFPPRAYGYPRTRESFKSKTDVAFDPYSAAETAADMTLSLLLHPSRASRLVQQKAFDKNLPGLEDLMKSLLENTFEKNHKDPYLQEIQQMINFRVLEHLMILASATEAYGQVNGVARWTINEIENTLKSTNRLPEYYSVEYVNRIREFREHPEEFKFTPAKPLPDGAPIGSYCEL
ncbi:zinc-dependent metalloprotease [Robertkochia flava]|uniref:zinc-dependent metalloprotease n=1 Tax=Robertkochia flava TaxID=3447986 RepID=UPI00293D8125|nr:zinc-dependent metalloprotease [Robertkochia marina]